MEKEKSYGVNNGYTPPETNVIDIIVEHGFSGSVDRMGDGDDWLS